MYRTECRPDGIYTLPPADHRIVELNQFCPKKLISKEMHLRIDLFLKKSGPAPAIHPTPKTINISIIIMTLRNFIPEALATI